MSATTTQQLTKGAVTLKGSAQMVAKFFDYGINSILYQRGIYPPGWKIICSDLQTKYHPLLSISESFTRKQEYGLTLLVSEDAKVTEFLKNVLGQIEVRVEHIRCKDGTPMLLFQGWLNERKVKKLVVVLTNVDTKEVLERWEFKVEYETEEEGGANNDENGPQNGQKTYKEVLY